MRVVWCRQTDGGVDDVAAEGQGLNLMGFDSVSGGGERLLIPRRGNFHKPLLSPDGDRVVFTELPEKRILSVRWDGQGAVEHLEDGIAVDVWRDPVSRTEWVYAIERQGPRNEDAGSSVFRFKLDDPFEKQLVWSKTTVNPDGFQVSHDGRKACGTFPWPDAGMADLEKGTLTLLGRGCWPSMSSGAGEMMWIFDGPHRNVIMVSTDKREKWKVPINGAPGMDGYEVYHPRWSNNSRYFAVSGPYKGGEGENRIHAGGRDVDIFVGKFDAGLTRVESWQRITENKFLDVYPDVWIAGEEQVSVAAAHARTGGRAISAKPVEVTAILKSKTRTPALKDIAPYTQALVVYEYEIAEVHAGSFEGKTMAVALWGIVKSKYVSRPEEVGNRYRFTVDRYDDHPELEGERLIMSGAAGVAPLYYREER